jgi:hypothetical protein
MLPNISEYRREIKGRRGSCSLMITYDLENPLPLNQRVQGSSPCAPTIEKTVQYQHLKRIWRPEHSARSIHRKFGLPVDRRWTRARSWLRSGPRRRALTRCVDQAWPITTGRARPGGHETLRASPVFDPSMSLERSKPGRCRRPSRSSPPGVFVRPCSPVPPCKEKSPALNSRTNRDDLDTSRRTGAMRGPRPHEWRVKATFWPAKANQWPASPPYKAAKKPLRQAVGLFGSPGRMAQRSRSPSCLQRK